jgi:hypothetical protein
MNKDRNSVQFKQERTYTLRPPKFKLFQNVKYLDTAKLSKGSHTIELGTFQGYGCDCAVTARISNGMIKGFNYQKCENATKIPPTLAKNLQAARRKLSKTKWKDIPVQELTRSSAARARIIVVVTTDGEGCYEVCIDPGTGLQTCWMCCPTLGWCIGPSDPHVAMF